MRQLTVVTALATPEAMWFESGCDRLFIERRKVDGLCFGRGDVSDGIEETSVVEPVDPFEGGVFDGFHRFPWIAPPAGFSPKETVDRLGEGVAVTVADAAVS